MMPSQRQGLRALRVPQSRFQTYSKVTDQIAGVADLRQSCGAKQQTQADDAAAPVELKSQSKAFQFVNRDYLG